jgi:excisionase family DNA binding protein
MAEPADPGGIDPGREALLGVLARHRVRFVLIGGAAIQSHGHHYDTQDIDLTPDAEPGNLARLADALNELDFRLITDPADTSSWVALPSASRPRVVPRQLRNVTRWVSLWSGAWRTISCMLTVAEAADRLGRNPETVRRWIRSGRLPARRVGAKHAIDDRDLRVIEDDLYPMSELPDEWRVGDDGTPAPNWVAALHRSRSGH